MNKVIDKRLRALESKIRHLIISEELSLTHWHYEVLLMRVTIDVLEELNNKLKALDFIGIADIIKQEILTYPSKHDPAFLASMGANKKTFDNFKRRIELNEKKPNRALIAARKYARQASGA